MRRTMNLISLEVRLEILSHPHKQCDNLLQKQLRMMLGCEHLYPCQWQTRDSMLYSIACRARRRRQLGVAHVVVGSFAAKKK